MPVGAAEGSGWTVPDGVAEDSGWTLESVAPPGAAGGSIRTEESLAAGGALECWRAESRASIEGTGGGSAPT